ncbi:MAG TPA: RNA polymerase sigma factor [Candidatus Polarisedimenticolia bacterium]|nr:RNA polymerase sigma factor [Candidatus Polarisedimenticolia bacterium]
MPHEPSEIEEDRQAVRRCLAGSVEAFEPLVQRHAHRLIRLSYHFLGDWEEARDLAQETLAKAYLCLHRYDPDRPLGPWLCTIASRLAADRLRQRRRARARRGAVTAQEPAGGLDADSVLSLKEALARLTPRQRQAVVLCDLHGFSASEASHMIDCSPSTVRVLRFLARRRLRLLLGPDLSASGDPLAGATGATEARE